MFNLETSALVGRIGVPLLLLLMLLGYRLAWRRMPATLAFLGTALAVFGHGRAGISAPSLAVLVLQIGLLWTTVFVIARHRQLRQTLRDRTGRLRTLVNTAVDGIIVIDDAGIVVDYNRACERLFGYQAEAVIGRNVKLLMPSPYCDEHDSYLRRYAQTGKKRIIGIGREVEGRRIDGTTFPMDLSVGETFHGDKRMFVGVVRDISARKAWEQELLDREARLRAVVDTAVDGVIIIDSCGTVQDYNPACEDLFGYRIEEVVGKNVKVLMPSPYHDEHDDYLERYRQTGERRIIGTGREVEGRRKDGTTFPLELSVGETGRGESRIFIGIIRDMTARKQAAAALQVAKEQAEAANQAKSIFLANMSHEIRTPMNAVLGYTQLLENELELPASGRQAVGAIKIAGNHLMGLISDILDLSKIEAGAEKLEPEDFNLDGLVSGLSEIFSARCEEKGLAWKIEGRFDHGRVYGDQRKLRQILINFLGNAVKFAHSGEVTLRITQTGRTYRFDVEDKGPGISAGAQKHIFEAFQQGEQGVAKGGTGLGLTIAKRQIELMGGQLGLESNLGVGSRFFFSVVLPPAKAGISDRHQGVARVARLSQGYRVKALVVDDAADNRDILARMLTKLGAEVSVASNGDEALESMRASLPDVVFTDIRMPVMDGRQTLHRIREKWPGRKIVCIAVSASGISHDRRRYVEDGFDDFIGKPFLFERITQCMQSHLDVKFDRQPIETPGTRVNQHEQDFSSFALPLELRQRLNQAARVNAFTDIENILRELRAVNPTAREFADYLQQFLVRYDRVGLLAALERTAH